jgi:transketolase
MENPQKTANLAQLAAMAKLLRYYSLVATAEAGSGHPSSCLSAADLMAALFFGGTFRADLDNPQNPNNDRLIFSKGHAAPLLYAIYAAAGAVSENELHNLRRFGSRLEGHPTMRFPYTEAATGSLGQGLSFGAGLAYAAKQLDHTPSRTYVLLGDSEMAEGSNWEAIEIAAHYGLDNLVGIIDVNGLGQRGETLFGHEAEAFAERVAAFGWNTVVVDGHDLAACVRAFADAAAAPSDRPTMIIARTFKGRGISSMENLPGWHGRVLKKDELEKALAELGPVDTSLRHQPTTVAPAAPVELPSLPPPPVEYDRTKPVSTRRAYGKALARLAEVEPQMIVMDAETSNSTFAELFKKVRPERFIECFIAEQNMVSMGLGLARRGKKVFVSTFAAFLSRAFDQIRMAQYSEATIVIAGSHCGVSIGEDGASQMGLEDIAMFRTIMGSAVLYPADALACERLVEEATKRHGITYLRLTRQDLPFLYPPDERFPVGGLKVLRQDSTDMVLIVAAGITVHEALAAHEELKAVGIMSRVIDLYSVKPLDEENLRKHARLTKFVVTVEDHYDAGGLGEAVAACLSSTGLLQPVYRLAVRSQPMSGKPEELFDYEEISAKHIVAKVKEVIAAAAAKKKK